ncbi:hypothetical protein BJ878DRAFT_561979 [Calycina marina]|uniref:DUF7892 domain-containing protein n=1 Tax=Calycina marina TaxID=1763456 RepID=A0A9P8CGD1_9HELO|nr:hypothetical protein BJ878DRAFT_561979 [Calycina marina]
MGNLELNDESDSDVSMSYETDDVDEPIPDIIPKSALPNVHMMDEPTLPRTSAPNYDSSLERKHADCNAIDTESAGIYEKLQRHDDIAGANDSHKLSKEYSGLDKSLLPTEIWQHIFTFIPPRTLGTLLRINKSFQSCIDPSLPKYLVSLPDSALQPVTADAIWQASRRLHHSGMPAPLSGKSELDMWRMACSISCEFCGKKPASKSLSHDQWHPGPGEDGVTPVWAFAIRTCGLCLEKQTEKEVALLLSSNFHTPLLSALPLLYFSNELHIILQSTIKNPQQQVPSVIRITKSYYKPHVAEIMQEYSQVKAMGTATVEEWTKGLDNRGHDRKNDAARWEKWEAAGGLLRMRMSDKLLEAKNISTTSRGNSASTTYTSLSNGHSLGGNTQSSKHIGSHPLAYVPHNTQTIFRMYTQNPPQRYESPLLTGMGSTVSRPRIFPTMRQEKTKEQVAETRIARRSEIERRCMLINPPITPGVLAHMGSFQAAMQIAKPLDDDAWEILKPRLMSQRSDAEQRENERLTQIRVVLEQTTNIQQDVQAMRSVDDSKSQEWEDTIQAPVRAKIAGYADESIRDGWARGEKVLRANCSVFAAQVLVYVRKRFYAEVAKDDAAVRASGCEPDIDPSEGPYTRKLTLENMKWVFETKIKPHTEQYRKEIFLCNDCEASKYYGFEGVVQHYAAKHTNALSLGTIVVNWRAEWPEYALFNPEPPTGKAPYSTSSVHAQVPHGNVHHPTANVVTNYNYNGVHQAATTMPIQTPGPSYGNSQYGDQNALYQNGPYAPPPTYQDPLQGYPPLQFYASQAVIGFPGPIQDDSHRGFGDQYSVPQGPSVSSNSSTQYPMAVPHAIENQPPVAPQMARHNYGYTHPPTQIQFNQSGPYQSPIHPATTVPAPAIIPKSEDYKAQLKDIAKNARDVWDTINGLKEVPGSVKVHTIIHHIVKRSRFNFQDNPTLAMMVDAIHNNKDMRKVRNINGLLCKVCVEGSSSTSQKKHFSFPQLINHFLSVHETRASSSQMHNVFDWTQDMVHLPNASKLSQVANSSGMNDQRLKLMIDALPQILFSSKTAKQPEETAEIHSRVYIERRDESLPAGFDGHEKFYSNGDALPSNSLGNDSDNDQYDPRRPLSLKESEPNRSFESGFIRLKHAADFSITDVGRGPQEQDWRTGANQRSRNKQSRSTGASEVELFGKHARSQGREDRDHTGSRVPRDTAATEYEPDPQQEYRAINSGAYELSRYALYARTLERNRVRHTGYLPADEIASRHNSVSKVVAQISEQAKQVQERLPVQTERTDIGLEEGELKVASSSGRIQRPYVMVNAVERFPDNGMPTRYNPAADSSQIQSSRRHTEQVYQSQADRHEEDTLTASFHDRHANTSRIEAAQQCSGYIVRGRSPGYKRSCVYDTDRHVENMNEQQFHERLPELVDRPYIRNEVIHHEERENIDGLQLLPSGRFTRYQSARLDPVRARSRSPIYVSRQALKYRERSPGARPPPIEAIYRTRQPTSADDLIYERTSGQEYYYVDEPRRQPQYIETFEYVRVADPQGDYMIRRPVLREAPVHATYEPEQYHRQPVYERRSVYESREPVARADPIDYEEEYDPRHPEPALPMARQVEYR